MARTYGASGAGRRVSQALPDRDHDEPLRARESQGLPRDAQEGADNYTAQQEYAGLQRAIVQSTIYGRSWTQDFEGVFRSILNYKGDVSYFDPALLKAYDEVIPEIERALGD